MQPPPNPDYIPKNFSFVLMTKLTPNFYSNSHSHSYFQFNSIQSAVKRQAGPHRKHLQAGQRIWIITQKSPGWMSSSSVAPQAVCLQIIFYDLLSENATKRKIRLAPPHAISQWLRTSRRRHRDDDGLHWSSRVFSCQVWFTSSWVVNRYQVVICAFLKDLI